MQCSYWSNNCINFSVAEPNIEEFPNDTSAIEGECVIFRVVVIGNPQPALTWCYQDIPLTPDFSLELQEDGSLFISSSALRHSGVYKLSVKNSRGSVEREVKLTVRQEEEVADVDMERVEVKPVPVAEFGEYVVQGHANSNEIFTSQYSVCESCNM
jgi:hypothetical protein